MPRTAVIGQQRPGVVPTLGAVGAVADDGAYVAYESALDARTVDLMVSSPGLVGPTSVRLFLPAGWATSPAQVWPVLYLVGGSSEKADYQAWSLYTDALSFLADKGVIVAMPADGKTGLGSNWSNDGKGPAAGNQWDTYLSVELPQLLRRGYRASGAAAIAGVSSGGFTAMAAATKHPDLYGAVASYSGLDSLSISVPWVQTIMAAEGVSIVEPWGSYLLNNDYWRASDPALHLSALRGKGVFLSAGNGIHGSLDPNDLLSLLAYNPLEGVVLTNSIAFTGQLILAGVDAVTDFYGAGNHSWPYWSRELKRSWPQLAAGLGLAG